MASSHALWFSIEAAFSEIEQLCLEARAAELVQQSGAEEADRLAELASGRFPAPASTAPSSKTSPQLAETAEGRDPRQARAAELSRDLAFRQEHARGADVVELRDRLRKRLAWLKTELGTCLSEHEVYSALFPIVAYTDELVASATRGQTQRWEPLQGELYEVDNGGELFFSLLDDRLRRDETSPLVFQIFLYCLKDGFVGMHQGDTRKLEEYRQRLVTRIPLEQAPALAPSRERPPVVLVPFPWKAYALAAALVLLAWVLFGWMAPSAPRT